MVVVHLRVRKWEKREKNGLLGHMNDVDHMITTSKGILLKMNHMSCQLNIALAEQSPRRTAVCWKSGFGPTDAQPIHSLSPRRSILVIAEIRDPIHPII
jgi:hypothetical protein